MTYSIPETHRLIDAVKLAPPDWQTSFYTAAEEVRDVIRRHPYAGEAALVMVTAELNDLPSNTTEIKA